jgi:5,10-methylene-tetrahydrofolate dehydrogenase/methenyl tetrahydrofolate cyclohydrolase
MIVDGRKIAEEVLRALEEERALLGRPLSLGILMSEGDAATESFIKIKSKSAQRLGVEVVRRELDSGATTQDALDALADLASRTDGLIVQLPLSASIDAEKIIAAIPPQKDVDAIGPKPRTTFAPVAEAVREVLAQTNTDVRGKKAVMVGAGRLVGKPTGEMLTQMGANVSFVTTEAGSLEELKTADIAVLGAGNPGFIRPAMLKPGIVLIDAGTSEAAGGKLMGDADPSCANIASVFTPVPGGIGPIAIAMIFKNLFELSKQHV